MKFIIKIEYDGKNYIALCANLIGCYAQSNSEDGVKRAIKEAISLYILDYKQRYEPFHPEPDMPQLNYHIRFKIISSAELSGILEKLNYKSDIITNDFLIFRKMEFPFYRIVIPNVQELSPVILKKLFGENNITQVLTLGKKDNIRYQHG